MRLLFRTIVFTQRRRAAKKNRKVSQNNFCRSAVKEFEVVGMKRWESLVDQKIREAMEQGEFDNLTGAGQPIDLSMVP